MKKITSYLQIRDKIHLIRGVQIILDKDLADLYEVETKNLNKAVKRNIERFPEDFMFQLKKDEFENLMFQIGTSNRGGTRKLPFAFTEHGITALSGVLRSKKAIEVNIQVIRMFVSMRKFLLQNASLFQKFQQIDQKLLEHDFNFKKVFKALEKEELPKKGIFFDGEIFDAHKFVSDLINKANSKIILIDNYIDYSTLLLFSSSRADTIIYTSKISERLKLDLKNYNAQYKPIEIKRFNLSHDRFLIVDENIYHFGASLKDLGKKWFGFSKFDIDTSDILRRLN